jgi:negative regulator of replication initiation
MTSIARLSGILRTLFVTEATQLAKQAGVIQRQRVFSGASLVHLLVCGWLTKPQGGPASWRALLARWACI